MVHQKSGKRIASLSQNPQLQSIGPSYTGKNDVVLQRHRHPGNDIITYQKLILRKLTAHAKNELLDHEWRLHALRVLYDVNPDKCVALIAELKQNEPELYQKIEKEILQK